MSMGKVPAVGCNEDWNIAVQPSSLSDLGPGDFTRAQWDHMSKLWRRDAVLADPNLDEVRAFLDSVAGDGL